MDPRLSQRDQQRHRAGQYVSQGFRIGRDLRGTRRRGMDALDVVALLRVHRRSAAGQLHVVHSEQQLRLAAHGRVQRVDGDAGASGDVRYRCRGIAVRAEQLAGDAQNAQSSLLGPRTPPRRVVPASLDLLRHEV